MTIGFLNGFTDSSRFFQVSGSSSIIIWINHESIRIELSDNHAICCKFCRNSVVSIAENFIQISSISSCKNKGESYKVEDNSAIRSCWSENRRSEDRYHHHSNPDDIIEGSMSGGCVAETANSLCLILLYIPWRTHSMDCTEPTKN